MLARAAAIAGKRMVVPRHGVQLRGLAARGAAPNLRLSDHPARGRRALSYAAFDLRVIPAADAWAKRRFAICYRSKANLRRRRRCWSTSSVQQPEQQRDRERLQQHLQPQREAAYAPASAFTCIARAAPMPCDAVPSA
jgi:hypothetical protein